eukprot:scaffold3055_cov27-Tisochrysis_lutea.AAC.2
MTRPPCCVLRQWRKSRRTRGSSPVGHRDVASCARECAQCAAVDCTGWRSRRHRLDQAGSRQTRVLRTPHHNRAPPHP